MIIGTKYKRTLIEDQHKDHYDYILIGSGISSLTLAILLSYLNKNVLVLEQHYSAGGLTHSFTRKGFKWDSGVHYIGEVHDPKRPVSRLFNFLSKNKLKWHYMGTQCDQVIIGPNRKNHPISTDKKSLIQHFPDEKENIDKYFRLNRKIYHSARLHFMLRAAPRIFQFLSLFIGKMFKKYSHINVNEGLESITNNTLLKSILSAIYPDYGLPPSQASYSAHAMVAHHYRDGGSYPIGGSGQIARHIVDHLNQRGTFVYTKACVNKILVHENSAYGVELFDGHIIHSKRIISSAGSFITFKKLVHNKKADKFLSKLRPSQGFFSLYIGLDESSRKLDLPKDNYWYYHDEKLDQSFQCSCTDVNSPIPYLFISFTHKRDPQNQIKPTMTLLTTVDYKHFEKWKDSKWKSRPHDYEKLKENLTQQCLQTLESIFPGLSTHISYMESSSPLTNQHFSHNCFGEPYGLAPDENRFESPLLRPKSPIKNLYTTGCDNIMGGVVPSMLSAIQTLMACHPIKGIILLLKIGFKK